MADPLTIIRKSAIALQWRAGIIALLIAVGIGHAATTVQQRSRTLAVVAASELTYGDIINAGDVRHTRVFLPQPGNELLINDPAAVIGKRVIGHIGAGEPITSTRVQQRSSISNRTAMALPISDADAALVVIGDRVDVYARSTSLDSDTAILVASDVEVIRVTVARRGFADTPATIVVLVDAPSAASLAAAKGSNGISIAVHGVDRSHM
mgnify:CR=1 FL=1